VPDGDRRFATLETTPLTPGKPLPRAEGIFPRFVEARVG